MKAFAPLLLLLPTAAFAIPGVVQHQGRVLDVSGVPIQGAVTLNIGLFEESSGGNPVWLASPSVSTSDGYYTVTLGAAPQPELDLDLLTPGTLWVEVGLGNLGDGVRTQLTAVPYALVARSLQLAPDDVTCTEQRTGLFRWNDGLDRPEVCDGNQYLVVQLTVPDTTPDAFSFSDSFSGENQLTTSPIVTVTGFDGNLPVSVTGDGTPNLRVAGGVWGVSDTIASGQTLQLRLTTGTGTNNARTATVALGGFSAEWTASTNPPCTAGPQLFTTSGSQTVNVPAGCGTATVWAVGGGGGGSKGGGGGGGVAKGDVSVSPGSTVSFVVGSGGTAGSAQVTPGGDGGTTTFMTLTATGGRGALQTTNQSNFGVGGTASGGSAYNLAGGSGGYGRNHAGGGGAPAGGDGGLCARDDFSVTGQGSNGQNGTSTPDNIIGGEGGTSSTSNCGHCGGAGGFGGLTWAIPGSAGERNPSGCSTPSGVENGDGGIGGAGGGGTNTNIGAGSGGSGLVRIEWSD